MRSGGGSAPWRRAGRALAALAIASTSACGAGSGGTAGTVGPTTAPLAPPSTTMPPEAGGGSAAAPAPTSPSSTTEPAAPDATAAETVPATQAPPEVPDEEAGPSTTVDAPSAAPEGFDTRPRSAPGRAGTALLREVRVARHDGFERVVFEFAGGTAPGYRVGWVDGPVTADGSGKEVEVSGEAHLELRFTPASGVDMATGSPVYRGPDRVPVEGRAVVLTDLVRTGDFEAVLTWVAGAQGEAPFRVTTLDGPVRVVVDLHAG